MIEKLKYEKTNVRKNGFTLVELLAIIVLLAIIGLIGFTKVSDVIKVSKENIALDSAGNYIKAVNLKVLESMAQKNPIVDGEYDVKSFNVDIDGTMPSSGTINIVGSKVSFGTFVINDITINYDIDSGLVIVNDNIDFVNGMVVYFNPTTNTKCNDYTVNNSFAGNTSGCLKWYAYLANDETVNLLLDHNAVETDISYSFIESRLNSLGWSSDVKVTIISIDDISKITGNSITSYSGISNYSWLYDNGGNYWTSSMYDALNRYVVLNNGKVIYAYDEYAHNGSQTYYGGRPTIIVNKNSLK